MNKLKIVVLSLRNYFKLSQLRNYHKAATIYIIGAGPSLGQEKLELIKGGVILSCNGAHEAIDRYGSTKSHYWLMSDSRRINEMKGVDRKDFDGVFISPPMTVPLKKISRHHSDVVLARSWCISRMKLAKRGLKNDLKGKHALLRNPALGLVGNGGETVVFYAMHLAAYFGAAKIVLLGFDCGVSGDGETHFNKSVVHYSDAPGRAAFDDYGELLEAKYQRATRPALIEYKKCLEAMGIALVNASCCSREDVLPKTTLEKEARCNFPMGCAE